MRKDPYVLGTDMGQKWRHQFERPRLRYLLYEEVVKVSFSCPALVLCFRQNTQRNTSICRRKFEIIPVIGTTVFPGVIKSLEMEL